MCKKILVLTLAVFLLVTFCNNGFTQDKAVRFGVRIGPNLAFTNGDIGGISIKARIVFDVGAFAEYWLSRGFAIQGGILYNKKGENWGESAGSASIDLSWQFDYLTIPIYGKAAFGDRTRFYLLFGLEPGFLLSAKQKLEVSEGARVTFPGGETITGPETVEEDLKDNVNSFEFALGAGMGVEIPLGQSLKLFIESRGSLGLTGIFKEIPSSEVIEFLEYEGVKNYIASVNLGMIF